MITSPQNGRIRYVSDLLSKTKLRRKERKFVSEGIKEFLEAPTDMISEVLVSEKLLLGEGALNSEIKCKLAKVQYETVADDVFKKLSDTVTPQGIITVLNFRECSLEDIVRGDKPLIVMLENLQDPGNLGTILRTAEGAGVSGIIMSRDCVDIYNPKVIRATMGCVYRENFVYVDSLEDTIDLLASKGITTYAAALDRRSKIYTDYDYTKGSCLLIGNEGNGLTSSIISKAGDTCFIPMEGKVESLNASVAAAILMYEAKRQRMR